MKRRTLLGMIAAVPMSTVLAGCGGGRLGEGDGSGGTLRLLNTSQAYPSLDLYVDDDKEISGVAYGNASDFESVPDGDITTTLTSTGSATSLLAQSRTLEGDIDYTVIAYGWLGALKSVILAEDQDDADSGKTAFSVWNLGVDAGPLDIYLTAQDEALDSATPAASDVSGDDPTEFVELTAGTYRLRITAAGDRDDLRLDASGLVLASRKVATLAVTGAGSGVLVNATLLPQDEAATVFTNTQARVRLVAAASGNARVSATLAGVTLGTEVVSSTVGDYVLLPAGSALPLVVTVDGVAVAASNLDLAPGSDTSVLVYGTAEDRRVTPLADDNRLPTDPARYRIRMVNVLANAGANLTLTASTTRLASDVAYGTSSTYSNQTPNTLADLRVTTPLSSTPLYAEDDVPLEANTVYTFFMMGDTVGDTAVGVLFNERTATASSDASEEA